MTEVERLQNYFSDFHKDFYGRRPRFGSTEQWNSAEWLQHHIDAIHDEMNEMKKTFAGREALREQGWEVPETDPTAAQQAKWLQEERDRKWAEMEREWRDSINNLRED